MKTLNDIFEHTLQDIYYAENAILKALPKVIEEAGNSGLKEALKEHLSETKTQVATLKKVFKSIGAEAKGVKCDAIDGLIKECEGVMDEAKGAAARNAGIIGCCQAIEHYEIARYGTLREWAKALGHEDAHQMLGSILDQEKAADHKLTGLAVESINKAA